MKDELSNMKDELTPEEEALIPVYYQKYMDQQTEQQPVEDIHKIINSIWKDMRFSSPEIIILDSPKSCKKACPDLSNFDTYWGLWLVPYAATYDFAKNIGISLNQEKLEKFLLWSRCCPYVLFNEETVYVSRKPVEIHYNDAGQLHNENGMSCRFADDWGIWTINGVEVDEQIVMFPETQTVKQIRNENNEEVKRIRIDRYGWDRYFEEINAKTIDERDNYIEGTKEFLLRSDEDNMTALLCVCSSTAKIFVLEVPPNIENCFDAQMWLSGGLAGRIISAS
jgi:hypothetical protein